MKEISVSPTVVQCHNQPARKDGKRSSRGVRESRAKWVTSNLYRVRGKENMAILVKKNNLLPLTRNLEENRNS